MNKEKQEFQLGDTAYFVDDDYRFYESEVYRIELTKDGNFLYETRDDDFEFKDIDERVFKTEEDRDFCLSVRFHTM